VPRFDAILILLLASGCGPYAAQTERTTASAAATLPAPSTTTAQLDEIGLQGDLVSVEVLPLSGCARDCAIGLVTLARPQWTNGGSDQTASDVPVVITDSTKLLSCGPSDAFARVGIGDLAQVRDAVSGPMPTNVRIGGNSARLPTASLQATKLSSGSCG
jgi:hypothetical protein